MTQPARAVPASADASQEAARVAAVLDLALAAPKSVSVYYASLLLTRDAEAAEQVLAAHRAGVDRAVDYLDREAAWGLADGVSPVGARLAEALDAERSAGPERRAELTWQARLADRPRHDTRPRQKAERLDLVVLEHLDARDMPNRPPHIHTHLLVRPFVVLVGSRRRCPLDQKSLIAELAAAAALYDLAAEESLMAARPVRMEYSTDTCRREVVGIKRAALTVLAGQRCRPYLAVRQLVIT